MKKMKRIRLSAWQLEDLDLIRLPAEKRMTDE